MSISRYIRLGIILLAVIIILGLALAVGFRKTVILNLNGQSERITTYAFTVGSLLHELDIPLSPLDELTPSQDTWLKNGDQVTLLRAIPVQVLADGRLNLLYSTNRTPSTLFAQAWVTILPGDVILSNGKQIDPSQPLPLSSQSISLQIIRAVNITISEDGQSDSITSTAASLGAALWDAGYTFFAADKLSPPSSSPLTQGLAATLQHSHQVIINMQDSVVNLRTAGSTVGEALEDASLSIQGLDYSLPSPEEPIPADGIIRVVHVTEDVQVEQSPLPFETQFQPVTDLELDSQSSLQTGEYGLSAQRVRIRYEDGQEVSRQVESQWIARQPVPRILGFGTMVVMHTTVVDGVEIQYWRALDMYATSYHPSEVGDTTASGLPLKKGIAAVDTSYIPLYTRLYIPGYGEAVAADIGGGVIGRSIDLGYSDSDYVAWHQTVTVYFLWPPPDNIIWTIP